MNELKNKNRHNYTLSYEDQVCNKVSLTSELAKALSMPINKEFGGAKDFCFDNKALFDVKTGKNILTNALDGSYTFNDLLRILKAYYKK